MGIFPDFWAFPPFGPHLLVLVVLVPSLVGKILSRRTPAGEVVNDTGEPLAVELLFGCVSVVIYMVYPITIGLYVIRPEEFQALQFTEPRLWTVITGTVLIMAGMSLICWARVVLAGNWVGGPVLLKQHELVTTGPYRFVRHPMYTGFAITGVGLTIATMNALPLICEGLFRGMLLTQTIFEERLLEARFGDDYRGYRARTGRIMPRIFSRRPAR